MLTSADSNVTSRVMIALSSRLTSSFTRRRRCFIFLCSRLALSGRFPFYSTATERRGYTSQFLCDLFELITLDGVANLIFTEITELDAAFQTGAYFLHVILESP